jgi:uncharacterized protein (DUF1697 family)
MDVQIALLRGINVGGTGILPMTELRDMLQKLGAKSVKTYIQSGNAVFRGRLDETTIADAIEAARGFRPRAIVLEIATYAEVLAANPFPEAVDDPKSLHLFFLASPSAVDAAVLSATKGPEERFVLTKRTLYLHTPKYLSGSKLAVKLERLLEVPTTARNWRSATKVLELAQGI